jgi:hypothetical protein
MSSPWTQTHDIYIHVCKVSDLTFFIPSDYPDDDNLTSKCVAKVTDKLVYQKQGCVEGDKVLFIYCLPCQLIYFVILIGILSVTLISRIAEVYWDTLGLSTADWVAWSVALQQWCAFFSVQSHVTRNYFYLSACDDADIIL